MTLADMKYISEIPTGFMVRKTINRKAYQKFFGFSRFKSRKLALDAALDYRDQLIETVSSVRTTHSQNKKNSTGIIGVSWSYDKMGKQVQCIFRGYYVDTLEKEHKRAFSVTKYGVWGAYKLAAEFRQRGNVAPMDPGDVALRFLKFFTNTYLDVLEHCTDVTVKKILSDAVVVTHRDEKTPILVLSAIQESSIFQRGIG